GELSEHNGQVVLRARNRSLEGRIRWVVETAPVPVQDPWDNYCPNYSPTFVRTDSGHLLEITTAPTDEGVCRPWYGSLGRPPGTARCPDPRAGPPHSSAGIGTAGAA